MKPIIEFKNFSFKYRSQKEPTIKDINLAIYPGEKVLIVGPSGSGKSTLANCINGLVPFFYKGEIEGTYTIAGQNPEQLGIFGLSKIVGTVLQDTDGQFIGLTVAEDIAFALENDKIPQPEMFERVAKTAELVEVQSVLDHAPGALSGGQKQRVSMAGVMINHVDILLFDEPLANLDPATGKHAIELIDEIHRKENTTVVIIEHRLEDALTCGADRIIVVGNGGIVADMTPDELLSTNVLVEEGIREPLYVTALKHAGCQITVENMPSDIKKMHLDNYKEPVKKWFQQVILSKKEPDHEIILEVNHLDFAYQPDKPVLQDISFQIHKGEMLSIVGKNGAGKSTLSNLICGFFMPDNGSISLHGENLLTWSIKERGEKIGLVMQNPNQMISKTMIFEEVALGLKVRGVAPEEIEKRVHETLKICGLYPFRNWPISALSYGQKKRVTIASILVMNPDIIILDEPTAGQDYRHYTEIMEFLKALNKSRGITIIMVTHDMHLMLEYTNRVLVISDGHLLADKRPSEVLTDDELTKKAYLKKTSLYDLAVRCGIASPSDFVECFIAYEQENNRKGKEAE
ncbi:MAG: ABC transporter ATP-binding protein [Lachnospiraceae bacterium]|nr:ABC transporter ATP-binding protein [Lachnospiraceae bacterium]